MGASDLVLIAMVNNERDLHIASNQRWYRIPVKSAPRKLKEMSYIAFYQTRAFGDQKWSINYWAEIEHISIVKRLELLPREDDHPRANNQYYKVEIGEMKRLPDPVTGKSGWRPAFVSTTLERFRTAKEIRDLLDRDSLEDN